MPGRRGLHVIVAIAAVAAAATASCGRGHSPAIDEEASSPVAAAAVTTAAPTTAPPTTIAPTTSTPSTTTPPATVSASSRSASHASRGDQGIDVHRGLATWVDVYDWSHYKNSTPVVGPAQVDEMAAAGVQTLYLQTAKHDTPDVISEPELLVPIIERAHAHGIEVVAWYLPTLEDPANDLRRLLASAALDVDGLAVDIESRKVGDVAERNRRLVELSSALRAALPGKTIAGIVLPPVLLEVVNPNYWPGFPWREIAPHYDVWLPMGYWTDRTWASGHRDAYSYTDENLRRLHANLGLEHARVHAVGGIGDETTDADLVAFADATARHGVIGASIYDWRTTRPDAWTRLRQFRASDR